MKAFIVSMACAVLAFAATVSAELLPVKEASKQIAQAVKDMQPLANSGVQTYKIKPTKNIKEAMKAIAADAQAIDAKEFEDYWVGSSNDAWGADTMSWGSATMKDAFDYVTTLEDNVADDLDQPENAKKKAKVEAQIEKAKAAFKLFLNTGVIFGVAPMGAVQCGVTFAALVIVDPYTGKVYVFSKEGSGC